MISNDVFVGGHPALDFINTVQNHDKNRTISLIEDWGAFRQWASASSLFTPDRMQELALITEEDQMSSLLSDIHEFRELIYRTLTLLLEDKTPNDAFRQLEQRIQQAIVHSAFRYVNGTYFWVSKRKSLEWVIDDIALSVEHLLRSPDHNKLRECGRCSWMFLNSGRGKGRRWCSMNTCGNRAKSSSFRQKK